jgi:hypothetical protein
MLDRRNVDAPYFSYIFTARANQHKLEAKGHSWGYDYLSLLMAVLGIRPQHRHSSNYGNTRG